MLGVTFVRDWPAVALLASRNSGTGSIHAGVWGFVGFGLFGLVIVAVIIAKARGRR